MHLRFEQVECEKMSEMNQICNRIIKDTRESEHCKFVKKYDKPHNGHMFM